MPPNNPENQNFEEMKKAFGDVIILNLYNKKHDHLMYAYSDLKCSLRHDFLSFQVIFCSFVPPLTPIIKIWKKCEETPGDIIPLHTRTINQDHMHPWYDVWFLRYEVQQTELFCHLGPFFASNNPKNENIKYEKNPGDIIILHKSTKNYDHPLYCSRDVTRDRCNCYFHFGLYFSLFTPLTAQKMKTSKQRKKKPGDILILNRGIKNHDQMLCYSWDIACVVCNCFFFFWGGQFLALLPL